MKERSGITNKKEEGGFFTRISSYLDLDQNKMNDEVASSMSDYEVLVASAKHPHLFNLIVERYQEAFLRKSKMMMGSLDEAEDMVQETFVKIYNNASKYKVQEGASFKSWGYKILINTCLTALKKRGKEMAATTGLEPEFYEALPDKSNTDNVEKELVMDQVLRVLSKMPNETADLLRKVLLEGKSYEDLSKDFGLSLGAVRTRLHRAKKDFKKFGAKFM